MNIRFPEIFGILLLGATACSFGLSQKRSEPIQSTFQFIYAPVTGPIQWMTSSAAPAMRPDEPLLTNISDETTRLREEKSALQTEIARLNGQLETLQYRANQTERIGQEIRESVVPVKIVGFDDSGRDVLRLSGSSTALVIERDAPVLTEKGLVGRVLGVGGGNQSSARLITDKGFKLLARFGRYTEQPDRTLRLEMLALEETLVEGRGKFEMRIESLRKADVEKSGLKVGDIVFLSDIKSEEWPIEVHGSRIGAISYIGDRADTTGVAEVRVRPEVDVRYIKDVWILGKKAPPGVP